MPKIVIELIPDFNIQNGKYFSVQRTNRTELIFLYTYLGIRGLPTMVPMVRRNQGPERERARPVIDNFFSYPCILLTYFYMFFFLVLIFCFDSDCYR
jgi:hypothetical protein